MAQTLRTDDGNLYESDAGEYPADVSFGRHGRPVHVNTEIGHAIKGVVYAVRRGLEDAGVGEASIEFGLVLNAEAGFVVSKGMSEAHVVVRMDIGRRA